MSKISTNKKLLLTMMTFMSMQATINPAWAGEIHLSDTYVRPDYVEVERMKDTKEVIVIDKKRIARQGVQDFGKGFGGSAEYQCWLDGLGGY